MAERELDMTGGSSFYDIPKISPTGTDTPSGGPVRDIPGREHTTAFDMTTMKQAVPAKPVVRDAPENDPRSWNMGGDGDFWSMFWTGGGEDGRGGKNVLGTKGKKPING